MTSWMIGFFVLFVVFGTLIATFAFIFLFLAATRSVAWWTALGIAGGISAAIWLIFLKALRFELYDGVIFGAVLPSL